VGLSWLTSPSRQPDEFLDRTGYGRGTGGTACRGGIMGRRHRHVVAGLYRGRNKWIACSC